MTFDEELRAIRAELYAEWERDRPFALLAPNRATEFDLGVLLRYIQRLERRVSDLEARAAPGEQTRPDL